MVQLCTLYKVHQLKVILSNIQSDGQIVHEMNTLCSSFIPIFMVHEMTSFDHNECLYGPTGSILHVLYEIKALFHHNGSN